PPRRADAHRGGAQRDRAGVIDKSGRGAAWSRARAGSLEVRPAALHLDAPYEPIDLMIEADLSAGEPSLRRVAACRDVAKGRSSAAADNDVGRRVRSKPVLVKPVATSVDADIEPSPTIGHGKLRRRRISR